jgi:hypothetical protein
MASERQIRANRVNATRSSGPRSVVGKAISRFNARRHGLESSIWNEPGAGEEIERLAQAIAGSTANAERLALAREVAKAEMMRRRVFRARTMHRFSADGRLEEKSLDAEERALDRAERRAISRRKSAIRTFDLLQAEFAAGEADHDIPA